MITLSLDRFASPVGTIFLVFEGEVLRALDFEDYEPRMQRLLRLHYGTVALREAPAPEAITGPLTRFFAGDATALDAIRVETGGTEFQRRVWAALRALPHGTTTSYGRLAAAIGHPTSYRAVGMANGANPVAIVVPCHRVIGADATPTGYGGGLPRKVWLLAHERGETPPPLARLDGAAAAA